MDDFSHITEELEVVEEGLKFRFNTARCEATDKEKVPKAEDFELFRVRRTYHFNKGREDHVILTIPEPECLVLINKQLKSMQQVRIGSDAPSGHELKPGAAAHLVAVKGLGCVVDDPTVEWVAAPDEDCGTAGVEAQLSSIEMDVNNANFNKQSEQDENLSAVKESCNSFSPVKLNSSEISSGTFVHLAIKRKKSSKQRSSKRLKRKLNSSISPERKCDDMCKIEQALIVALKNSESCKSSEVNRLHNISTTKITQNAKERSNMNGDAAAFKEKLGTNRINEACRECTVRLEDISSILNATYENRFNSRIDQIQEAEEASVCLKENLNTELNSGEKPPELSVAQEENLIRVEDNLFMDNISTKTYKNAEKVGVCSNITRGNSTLRKMLEAPLKSSKFNQNAATTTQLERFYKRAYEQRAKQIEEESIPNSLTSIQKDSELNKDLTDGVYRKNTLTALHEVSQSEKNSNKIQHKLDFNKSTFQCDPGIIIKEEFNCFMEDHAFLQNETRSGTSSSLRNSDFKNEKNEENWIYGQPLFQDQHIAQLEEYGRTAERVHKSEIIEEFEETFMNYTNNSQTQQNSTEETSEIFLKSEESSGFADEEHEESFFASRNSRIQQNLTEQVCEVEIFIPDDDDESESGYSQEHSQMDESNLEQEKMQNTEICRIGSIVTDKTRVQKNISIVANDSKKSVAENNVAIALIDSHINASSLEENQHNCDPEDVRTCDDKVATTEITIKDVYTQDCSQTNANSPAGNVESQGRIQEQVSFDPSSCNFSEDAHSCNDELANMDTSSSEDIHKIQENIESRNMDCGSKEIQHCDQNTHCIQADAEDAQMLQENRKIPEKISWGAQNCHKNVNDDAERTCALEHFQMDADTSGDSHRSEKIVETPGEINLECRRTEDHNSSDSHEGVGARTTTHLQIDTNSSEDKLQPPVATLNARNILEQNNYDGNELKGDCVSELYPRTAISPKDAHQSQKNLESPIRFVRNENNIHNHDTCDSNKDKTTVAVEFSLMNTQSTEDAHILQDNSVPLVEVAWDGKNFLKQNTCDTNGDKSVCVREPSPTSMIVSDDAHQSQENFEPLVEVPQDGRNILKQNIYDADGDKSVCVREPTPTPTIVSEDAHQSQENFELPLEVARDGRNVCEENNSDVNRDKNICVREPSPAPMIVSEDAHQSQENFELLVEVAQDERNIYEQNSCDANGGKSVSVLQPSPTPTIVSENTHQSQENFEPLVEVARDGRNIHVQNSSDANRDKSICVREPSPAPMIVSEDNHQLQENFELPLEVAQDGRNVHEQNSCDANRDKSICVHELSPAPTIVSKDAHQSQENFEPPVEVARDGRNILEQSSCNSDRDKSVCVRELSPALTIVSKDAHQSQENFEPPVEVARDGRNSLEQSSCDADRDKSICVRELSPAPTIVSKDAHQSQENFEPLVEVARDGRNVFEQNSCDAIGEGAHKSKGNFEPPVEVARCGRNILEQNSCDVNGEGAHKSQGNFEPSVEVAQDRRNVHEQNSHDANRGKSVCVRELSPAPTIVFEDAHQSQENLEPLVEVVRDGRNILEQNSCEANGEPAHKSQGSFEPSIEVAREGRNVLEQNNSDVSGFKSVCIHKPPSISIISSEDARQSQENLSSREVVRDGRESCDRNTCSVDENTCAGKDSEMDISTLEDVHKLQENLQPLLEVTCDGRNIQERNSCESNEDENTCTRKYSEMDISSLEDVHKLQENLEPGEVTWNGRNIQKQNSCNGNEDNNTCASKDSELDIHSLEDVHKLQENLGSPLEVTWDEREVQKQNNCDCNEDKCACAMELSPVGSSSSEDANKPMQNLEVPIEVASDEKQIHKQNSCDYNEVKSACALEFSQMDTSFAEDKEECREAEKKVDRDDNEDKSAFKCSQIDMSSAEDVRKVQENLEPVEKIDLNETKMQQSNLNQSKDDGDEDKRACAVKLLHMDTSSSVDVNEFLEKIGLDYRKIKDNKNESACALECSLKISTSSEATNKIETNFEPLEMGFDEENIPAYIVTKIPHDFVGFSDEESKTPLLNLILTDDLYASEDNSGDLCKTEDSCKFSSSTLEFYKFCTKRIKLIEENLPYICNKHSLYKQYEIDEKPILNRKNAREVLNSRNLTEIVDHDYVKEYRNVQSNFMLNREQGTQTLATNEDFANKTNDKSVFNQEGRQVEEMAQRFEELFQEHIKSLFAQDGIDEEIPTDQEKNDIKVEEEKENKGSCDHANNSEEMSEVSQNKKNSSDLKPAATPKHTQVFEYNTELSNDSIISERQLEIDHGDSKGNVANDKKSSDIFMEVNDKNGKLFKCIQCNFKVNKENHLKIHSRVHILSCWCNICSETFSDTTALQKHVKVSHSSHFKAQRVVMNNSGEKPFQSSSDKPSHISNNDLSHVSNENLYKCGYCNYTTSYINRLQHHKRVHDKEKLYECGKCSFTTLRKWKLKRHHQNVHSSKEELRECDECGFISIYQHEWDMHVQLHSGKKLYQCDMCSFSTAHVGYFHAHRGFHLPSQVKNEEPDEPEDRLRCEECDYRTDLHSSLVRHGKKFGHRVVSHPSLSQSQLVCSECNYVANSYVTLKQHLMTHIDLKPCHLKDKLECSKCKKVCLTHKDLKRHMNKEHPGIA